MFGWIDKVIPKPPETPKKASPDGQDSSPASPSLCDKNVTCSQKETTDPSAASRAPDTISMSDKSSVGVLGWLAQGLGKVVPQPVDSPILARENKEVTEQKLKAVSEAVDKVAENGPVEQSDSSSMGVLSWLSHGLEKVVPKPTWSSRASTGAGSEPTAVEQKSQPEKVEEVIVAPASPAISPVPAPPPVAAEVPPVNLEEEAAAVEKKSELSSGTGVINWLKQGLGKVVPHPEMSPAAAKTVEVEILKEEEAPPAVARKESRGSTDSTRMLNWISQGLEKVIPQPVITAKQDSQNITLCQVEEKGSGV